MLLAEARVDNDLNIVKAFHGESRLTFGKNTFINVTLRRIEIVPIWAVIDDCEKRNSLLAIVMTYL